MNNKRKRGKKKKGLLGPLLTPSGISHPAKALDRVATHDWSLPFSASSSGSWHHHHHYFRALQCCRAAFVSGFEFFPVFLRRRVGLKKLHLLFHCVSCDGRKYFMERHDCPLLSVFLC
jgi:hypothetical protein